LPLLDYFAARKISNYTENNVDIALQ
jgi:hypothetical protein